MNKWFFLWPLVFLISCKSGNDPKSAESAFKQTDYYTRGSEITGASQAELMKNVQAAMIEGGPVYAINYCNLNVSALTDSLSGAFRREIGRISLKNRNPENAPKGNVEISLLNKMLEKSLEGSEIRDTIVTNEGNLIYYKPIFIGMESCLKCHGQTGSEINNETMSALNKLYPEDEATNFRMGEFRGVWKVTFPLE